MVESSFINFMERLGGATLAREDHGMKHSDIQELCEKELITAEQRDRIVQVYGLKERSHQFMAIISWFGGLLIASGIILLISSNWERIPGLVKIGVGVSLMVGVHAAALGLKFKKTAEVLHLVGSLMFLANIALVGQVYHLSSRPGNAFLAWFLGIAALPWILKSRAQWMLALIAFGLWFGVEVNDRASAFNQRNFIIQMMLFSAIGVLYTGIGSQLRRTSYARFGKDAEQFGTVIFHLFTFPALIGIGIDAEKDPGLGLVLFGAIAAIGFALHASAFWRDGQTTRSVRQGWFIGLLVAIGGVGAGFFPELDYYERPYSWCLLLVFSVLSILRMNVGVQCGSRFEVNFGILSLAVYILTFYLLLVGSMARTGVMFIVSGILLLGMGVVLERKRRQLLSRFNLGSSVS